MKKKIFQVLGCTMLAVMLLTSCKDEELPFGNEIPVEKGKLSFVLPLGEKKAVTYANVAGEDDEYAIKRLRIYWFKEADQKLFKVFNYGDGLTQTIDLTNTTLTGTDNTTYATINVGSDEEASRFYIIANVNGSSVKSDALLNVHVGVTSCTDFEALLSNALEADPSAQQGELALIQTPLPMSVRDEGADPSAGGYITVDDPANTPYVDVHLKRRVARFDIINTAHYSNFQITNIRISKAQKQGWLHDKAFTGTETWAANTGNIIVDASNANGPVSAKIDDNLNGIYDDFEKLEGALDSLALTKAVFYLWPTQLLQDGSATEIVIEGKYYDHYPRLYKLELPTDVIIEANKLYRIKVVRATDAQIRFNLIVDDWDDELEIPAVNIGSAITNWGTLKGKALSGDVTLDLTVADQTFEYASALTDTIKLTIVNEGTNLTPDLAYNHVTRVSVIQKDGTTVGTDFLEGDLADTRAIRIVSTTVLTYGTHYTTTHEVWLAPTNAPIETTLQILSAANPQDAKTITLKSNNYGKTGIPPVKIGNLLWAPVNVGATKLFKSGTFGTDSVGYKYVGDHFQWGRNVPFPPYLNPNYRTTAITNLDSINIITDFVKLADWFTPINNSLWSDDKAQGPCPTGWRIPTSDEFTAMINATNRVAGGASLSVTTYTDKNDPTNILYFPFCGKREGTTGVVSLIGGGNASNTALIWTSTALTGQTPYRLAAATNGVATSESRGCGLGVRAVMDVQN